MDYDENIHLHVGYYENEMDIEAIALKRKGTETWDIFINFQENGVPEPPIRFKKIEPFGCQIMSISITNFNEEICYVFLKNWIESQIKNDSNQ